MIYDVETLTDIIRPITDKYDVKKVVLFGSYAREEATEQSDVDLLYSREGSKVKGLFAREGFRLELEAAFGKTVDIIPLEDLEVDYNRQYRGDIVEGIKSSEELLVG